MKKILFILLLISSMLLICGCSATSLDKDAEVTLTFVYGEENIHVSLSHDEAQRVIEILDGNTYDPPLSPVPSCGFDKNISLKAGNRVYAIACDTCNYIQDLGNLRFFSVSKENMAAIHALFEKYGGYFPCN